MLISLLAEGVLSFFALQSGARKVYAIEASNMALHCKKLVKENHFADKMTVIAGKVEEVSMKYVSTACVQTDVKQHVSTPLQLPPKPHPLFQSSKAIDPVRTVVCCGGDEAFCSMCSTSMSIWLAYML